MKKSVLSYNVNGIRAACSKGFIGWLLDVNPDIVCLQELKARPEDLDPDVHHPDKYFTYWFPAEKKGYSGVAIFSKEEPLHVEYGCGMEKYDKEGRVIRADFKDYSVMSVYLPSGTMGGERQVYKEEFMDDFFDYIRELKKEYPNLIISGDFNICHKEIDIHNPVSNKNSSGFLPHERAWITKFLDMGFKDSLRLFNNEPHNYTWWSFRARARENNKGWRIDYHMVTNEFAGKCKNHLIHTKAVHSDHAGMELIIDVD